MRKLKWVGVILALCLVMGCAAMKTTEEGTYYKALGCWYDTTLQFKRYYTAADEEQQMKWDAEFRPMLIHAKEILNMWYIHLDDGQPTAGDYESWKELKNDLLFYFAQNIKGQT